MNYQSYSYNNDILSLNSKDISLPLSDVLKTYERPTYIYNKTSIENRIKAYTEFKSKLDFKIHYALKANTNPQILSLIQSHGLSADVVSWGEATLALEANFKASDIIFSGVGKTKFEIQKAIENNVGLLNVESAPELKRIIEISQSLNKSVNIGLRINPDISVETHPYIATGFRENKFGVSHDDFNEIIELLQNQKSVKLMCLGLHIGSQIQNLNPFKASLEKLLETLAFFKKKGFEISDLDLGGGIGIDYLSSNEENEIQQIRDWMEYIHTRLKDTGLKFHLEPGRSIVARSGVLVTEVQYIKRNQYKNFVIVDTGMHHLMRPSLYQAHHRILPLKFLKNESESPFRADVVGPICESSDVIGYDRSFHTLESGDLIAIMDTGAYGFVMSSNYNHHPKPLEILF
jgi:diaminopimelate decarboxylase